MGVISWSNRCICWIGWSAKCSERWVFSRIVRTHSRSCNLVNVNDARRELFTQGSRPIEKIPPTKGALLQHTKRAVYQAGYICSQALTPSSNLPNPVFWGWSLDANGWIPFLTNQPDAFSTCYELVHCGCLKGCKKKCKCKSSNLKCTELCKCKGFCLENRLLLGPTLNCSVCKHCGNLNS